MVSPIQPEEDPIRVYPEEYRQEDVDAPNQINFDLKETFGFRAVALHAEDGDVVEWWVHSGGVLQYWPGHLDEPVWKRASIYDFRHPIVDDGDGYYALHQWQEAFQKDAEVVG